MESRLGHLGEEEGDLPSGCACSRDFSFFVDKIKPRRGGDKKKQFSVSLKFCLGRRKKNR